MQYAKKIPSSKLILKIIKSFDVYATYTEKKFGNIKDVPGDIPKSDLLGVTVARIHVAGQ